MTPQGHFYRAQHTNGPFTLAQTLHRASASSFSNLTGTQKDMQLTVDMAACLRVLMTVTLRRLKHETAAEEEWQTGGEECCNVRRGDQSAGTRGLCAQLAARF